ncbi:MAG: hydrogenase maturation protease [Nitrososphaerales archaeon]|nr:hydrogenase maturation protease [Nitrososphaerales archaeon]
MKRLVIIGVGNLLMGDEGVGVYIANRLRNLQMPEGVEVHECGTGGLRILEALEGAERAIIIDAVRVGGEPGTIYRFPLSEVMDEERGFRMVSSHDLDLITSIRIGELVGIYKLPRDILVIGVEPEVLEVSAKLSPKVERAVEKVIELILKEIEDTEREVQKCKR